MTGASAIIVINQGARDAAPLTEFSMELLVHLGIAFCVLCALFTLYALGYPQRAYAWAKRAVATLRLRAELAYDRARAWVVALFARE